MGYGIDPFGLVRDVPRPHPLSPTMLQRPVRDGGAFPSDSGRSLAMK
jgi:hypothetical protein